MLIIKYFTVIPFFNIEDVICYTSVRPPIVQIIQFNIFNIKLFY